MNIALIGSGNIATQLGFSLLKAGNKIDSIYSKNFAHAAALAKKLHAHTLKSVAEINAKTDLILIAVNDDAIEHVAQVLPKSNATVVHTSGSVSLDVLKKRFKNCGVFYPLQTINKNHRVNFKTVPVCIEASNKNTKEQLGALAETISENIYLLSSNQRLAVHVAAVFANNFGNHMLHIAEDILQKNNLTFDLIRPLISISAKKVQHALPSQIQTGPAKRNDKKTIAKHLLFLKNDKELSGLYKQLTDSIIDKNKL